MRFLPTLPTPLRRTSPPGRAVLMVRPTAPTRMPPWLKMGPRALVMQQSMPSGPAGILLTGLASTTAASRRAGSSGGCPDGRGATGLTSRGSRRTSLS